ncbi:MAG: site-2 protease family protein [Phycisphaerales bacterium]|nr:site-2 protease family protein [Phycisphaerales bacterium]
MGGGWWVTDVLSSMGWMVLISWVFWVIFSICLHELGHGWAAIRHGDRTPIELGHMTWNPLVHMGQMSLLMFAIVGIAWGAMPINPTRMRGRHAEAVVSAAGPAVNAVLVILTAVGAALVVRFVPDDGGPMRQNLWVFFYFGCMLNLVLLVLNLLPVPPLDGSRILGHYVPAFRRAMYDPQKQLIFLGVFILIFIFGGKVIFDVGSGGADRLIGLFLRVFG